MNDCSGCGVDECMKSDQASPDVQPPARPEGADSALSEEGTAGTVTPRQIARAPDEAMAANLDGKQIVGPQRGFGPLWQRTYRVRLEGIQELPATVMEVWKANFPAFQPPNNRFYPSPKGVAEGEVVFVDSNLVEAQGMRAMTEMASGVVIVHVDDLSFTVMTPEGFPVSGWNTFSVSEERGAVVAQVQGLERTADPVYEFGYRFLGGEAKQDATWVHVLRSLAAHFGVTADVHIERTCLDSSVQWRNVANVRQNAAIRTLLHRLTAPLRALKPNKV